MNLLNKYAVTVLLGISVLFSSCATMQQISPRIEKTSFPDIGIDTTRNVGEILISQGTVKTAEGITVLTDYQLGNDTVGKGKYIQIGKQEDYLLYEATEQTITYNGKPTQKGLYFLALNTLNNEIQLSSSNGMGGVYIWDKKIPNSVVKIGPVSVESLDNFQQTLIYAGKEGNIIKLSYREFTNSLARPAFTLDSSYDLSESKSIIFKNAQITVLSATSADITYKVIKNFN